MKLNHIYLSNYASDLLQSNKNKVNCCYTGNLKVKENAENVIRINKYIKKKGKK